MPAQVVLEVSTGAIAGKRFEFDSHHVFLFGRSTDCHACLPNDGFLSRHQFVLEVSPPVAALRDLGSLNGTIVNRVRYGGRGQHETPAQGAARVHPSVELHDGDEIVVGNTTINVKVTATAGSKAPRANGGLPTTSPFTPSGELANLNDAAYFTLPGYELNESLGEGGMGVVYRALRLSDQQPVAIKWLQPQTAVEDDARTKFLREIETLRRLTHPAIVQLHDFGERDDAFYFVMEYCAGGNVNRLREAYGGKVPLNIALPIMLQVLEGLAQAHASKFVHRDIKPDNLLLQQQPAGWRACLADFGLAKKFEDAGFSGITATNQRGGTLYFMPREQLTNFRDVKPTGDVWSAAATFYFLLTGQHPRDFSRAGDPVRVILQESARPIREREAAVPAALAAVINRALQDDPAQRPADGGAFLQELLAALQITATPTAFRCDRLSPLSRQSASTPAASPVATQLLPATTAHTSPPVAAYRGAEPYLFVSYSHRDSALVCAEIAWLQAQGYRVWYDEGIEPGGEWPEEIAVALAKSTQVLVFVSPAAASSVHVRNEVNFALNRHKPLLIVHLEPTELPPGLELRIGDLQAILRHRLKTEAYRERLGKSLTVECRAMGT